MRPGAARWRRVTPMLLALVAGACLPLAFAPFSLPLIAPLSLAVLFALWRTQGVREAALSGYLFGLGAFGVGVNWVYNSMALFGGMTPFTAGLATALFILFLALFPAAAGAVAARLARQLGGVRALAVIAVAWVLAEWVRGWFLGGFPWLNPGFSQIDTWLMGYAPLLGVHGVHLALAITAAALVWLCSERSVPRRAALGAAAIALVWGAGAALDRIEWTEAAGEPRSVALVQGNVPQALKWDPAYIEETLRRYADLTQPHWGTDLVIWPEAAIPVFLDEAIGYVGALEERAQASGTRMLVGVPVMDWAAGRYHNSVVTLGPGRAFYHKRHLVPLGEYLPLRPLLGPVLSFLNIPMSNFAPGPAGQGALPLGDEKVGVSICYEAVFGEEVIDALPAAGYLVNVSNDAWFGDSVAPHQHLQMARFRARETERDLLRATNTGVSAVIDHRGAVRARSGQSTTEVVRGTYRVRGGATPYVLAGNAPAVVLAFLLLLAARLRLRLQQ